MEKLSSMRLVPGAKKVEVQTAGLEWAMTLHPCPPPPPKNTKVHHPIWSKGLVVFKNHNLQRAFIFHHVGRFLETSSKVGTVPLTWWNVGGG